jgi:transketolase
MPSWEIFEQQDAAYKENVLPCGCHGASFRGDGSDFRLGTVHRKQGKEHRDAQVWRIGTA